MAGLLDRIVVGVNKGVTVVGAASKAMIEKAKINTAIENFESERTRLVQSLGQKVFDMYEASSEIKLEEVTGIIAEIRQRIENIAQQQELLRRVDEEVTRATNAAAMAASQSPKNCECGQTNPPEAKFCAGCGSPL